MYFFIFVRRGLLEDYTFNKKKSITPLLQTHTSKNVWYCYSFCDYSMKIISLEKSHLVMVVSIKIIVWLKL